MNFFLPYSKSKSEGEGENLQKAIKTIFTHSKGIVDGYLAINSIYRSTIERSLTPVEAAPLLEATTTFHKDLTFATGRFQDCLTDLLSMCSAMESVIASSPEAALPLMTNFYSSFSRQLCTFYSDISAASSLNGKLFQKGALDIVTTQEPKLLVSSFNVEDGKTSPSVEHDFFLSGHAVVPASPSTTIAAHASASSLIADASHERGADKGKASSDALDHFEEDSLTSPSSPIGVEDASRDTDQLNESIKKRVKKKRVVKVKNITNTSGRSNKVRNFTLKPSDLPTFLPVVSTIEEALGNEVWSKRPDTFSFLHQFFAKAPEVQYYIEFPAGNTLADWVFDLYLDIPSSSLSTLAQEVLPATTSGGRGKKEEDEIQYGCFQAADGPLSFFCSQNPDGSANRLSGTEEEDGFPSPLIPSCGWREISRVRDPSLKMYSMYMFLQGPPPRSRFVVIHEALSLDGGRREEVVHVVEEMIDERSFQEPHSGSPSLRFARVSAYSNETKHSSSSNSSASLLIKWIRKQNAAQDYKEVSEPDVRTQTSGSLGTSAALLQNTQSSDKGSPRHGRQQVMLDQATLSAPLKSTKPHENETSPPFVAAFSPISVQLASLENSAPSVDSPNNPSFGAAVDAVTKGVTTVFTAPLTIGKAFMELTGANEALQRHLEDALKRCCPDLQEKEILNASPCEYSTRNGMSVPVQGAFYVLPKSVCFLSSSGMEGGGTGGPPPIQLEYEDIKDVKKCRVERSEAIEVASHIGECFTLSNLHNRNTTYSIFVKQWLNT